MGVAQPTRPVISPDLIDDETIHKYVTTLTSDIQESEVANSYANLFPDNHLVYPARIQAILSTTGFVLVFVGHDRNRARIEISRVPVPYQTALFGENTEVGRPAITIAERFFVMDGLVLAQRSAIESAAEEVEKVGGVKLVGDRLIDVAAGGDVTLLNCYFHFVRQGNYEHLCQELILIGSNPSWLKSDNEAREKAKHLLNIMQRRIQPDDGN